MRTRAWPAGPVGGSPDRATPSGRRPAFRGRAARRVALPVVDVPPWKPTTVPIVTSDGPVGEMSAIASSSVDQAGPSRLASERRVATTSIAGIGARSCGSSDTWSPVVRALPSKAVRSISGSTAARTSAEALTVTVMASLSGARSTRMVAPSGTPRLPRTSSSQCNSCCPAPGGDSATRPPVVRAPCITSTSHGAQPSAARASGCSRTMPRRWSSADGCSRAVRSSTAGAYAGSTRCRRNSAGNGRQLGAEPGRGGVRGGSGDQVGGPLGAVRVGKGCVQGFGGR